MWVARLFRVHTDLPSPSVLSQEPPHWLWVHVSRSSYLLHLKTTQSSYTSTYIIWFSSSLPSVSSKCPPQSKPKVHCTNLGKIPNINHRCLSSSCKHLKAPQGHMHRKSTYKRQRKPSSGQCRGPFSSCTSQWVQSKACLTFLFVSSNGVWQTQLRQKPGL